MKKKTIMEQKNSVPACYFSPLYFSLILLLAILASSILNAVFFIRGFLFLLSFQWTFILFFFIPI